MAILRIENGPQKGTKVPLPSSGNFIVGSEPKTAQLVLVDPKVSRLHFTLSVGAAGAVTLKDLGAAEGTLVNGKKASAMTLQPGDRIQAGDTLLVFDPKPVSASAPTEPGATKAKSAAESGGVNLSGQTIGGYRIEKLVGRGGMGTVYRAVQISLDRIVALKVLSSKFVADRSFVELFFREARAAGKLNNPHVVQVYDVGEASGIYFYSMEFMEGGTMEGRIAREGKVPVAEAVEIVRDAARGLQFAEAQKIVHRDIKPDNIMLSMSGHAKIADLGLAAPHDAGESGKGKILGTPHFMSPEQAKGQPVDARSDLYSLGATFFRILTGKTPFSGATVREILQKQVQEQAPRVRELAPEVPEEIDAIVARLLEKDPAARFQSAKDLVDALEAYLNPKGHSGRKVALLAGAPLLLVAAALLVWKPWEKKDPQIIEKIVERPADPSKAAEAARMRKELLEKEAHIAFQGVSAAAPAAEKLDAYEKVAAKYPETEYGKSAKREADILRRQIEEANRLAAERAARLVEFEKRLRGLAMPLLEAKRFREAAIAVGAAPELAASPVDEDDRQIAGKIYREIAGAEDKEVSAWLREASNSIEESNFANAEANLAKLRDAIAPTESVPDAVREGFAQHLEAAEKARARLEEKRSERDRALFEADVSGTHAALFADGFLAQEIANLRFAACIDKVEALQAGAKTDSYRDYLARWKADLESCERAMTALVAHVQAQTLTEKSVKNPLNGRTQPAVGASRAEGVAVPDPAKRDSKIWIGWDKFHSSERVQELFKNRWAMKADEAADAAQLLLLVSVAMEAEEFAKDWRTAPENGKLATAPLFDPKIFQNAKEWIEKAESLGASKERCESLNARVRAEEEAAATLSRSFRDLFEKNFDAALREMEKLREQSSSTLLFGCFTDGTTPLPGRKP